MRLLRDPLLHFLAFGVIVLGVDRLRPSRERPRVEPSEDRRIVIDEDRLRTITARQAEALGRSPTAEELDLAVAAWVDEELLVREARRLGLDREDPVIRARLAQQQVYLTQALTLPPEPDEAELQALWAEVQEDFQAPARLTVRQLWVADPAAGEARARALQARWQAGEDPVALSEEADPPPGGPVLRNRSPEHLARQLGEQVAAAALALPQGQVGVVAGAEGWHVLRVEARQEGGPLPYEQARARLVLRWKARWQEQATAAAVEGLRGQYEVVGWP